MTKKKMIIIDVIAGILIAALIVGNCLAMTFSGMISIYLDQETWGTQTADGDAGTIYYESEFSTAKDLRAAQETFAKELQAEATVLLQNTNDILPLDEGAQITFLGAGSAMDQFMVGGIGSGAIDTSSLKSLTEVFETAGYGVNQTMVDFYTVGAGSGYRRVSTQGIINECPVSEFTGTETASFADYQDAAIIVIGRESGEGAEIPKTTEDDPDRTLLQLSAEELELIDYAAEHFDKTVVLLNTTMPMVVEELADKEVAVLYIGGGGMSGYEAIPEILNGVRYPSGRLADTYVKETFSAPSNENYDVYTFAVPEGAQTTFAESTYTLYQEGIYVGYRYYETRYEDVVMGTGNAGTYDYGSEVMYPFGYGLNYTTFEWSDFEVSEQEDSFDVTVRVSNTGSSRGKDVVGVYMQSPYTEYDKEHGVEKAAVELAGFAKTKELAPGENETLTIRVPKEYMRSYDADFAKTYIVDAGTYYFTAAGNAHDAVNNILAQKGYSAADGMSADGDASMVYSYEQEEFDSETYSYGADGEKITNQFDNVDLASYMDDVVYLSRNDWQGTWPSYGETHPTLVATSEMLEEYALKHEVDETAEMPVTGADNNLTLASMAGMEKDDESWELLLDQMTAEEMMNLVENGGYYTILVESVNKPKTLDKDGPSGITSTLIGGTGCFGFPIEMLVACSWNVEMSERLGELVGEDGLMAQVSGWYAPGLNTHRNPFNGRNYEYYSEDPVLGVKIGTAVVIGCQSKGTYAYIKHFALDDQGTGGAYTFANEQAIREIYLRQFEETVTVGDAHAAMTNNGCVGMTWCGRNENLMTNVLRNEWGFDGFVISDQATGFRSEKLDMYDGLMAGTDLWLNSAAGSWIFEGYDSNPTFMNLLRNACKNILYTVANSNAMNGLSADTTVANSMPTWQKALIAVNVLAGVLVLAVVAGAFISYMKKNVLIYKDVDRTETEEEEKR